ncbi:PASTA domain-containing protein [Arthrobacter sp. B2a2-09]|uniref:PASTA domain-containing protein n=1 Tax=Arthrobacter sp. B2a2-09 TaxID=2952822 RepID=UPI0022CD5AB6|nr:PASTA domain-containing protein [Arthrobacter sp. B2a2-09]MCZ9882886.1 PASTA domain-containing protein [Arthrobacter sp. B2a2-09]
MSTITMTLSSPTVELKDGKGSLTASVTNGAPGPERVVLGAFPGAESTPPSPTYTTIPTPLRTIAAGATEQYLVNFDTAGAAPGTFPVKLIAYSADDAPEDYADQAHVVTLNVTKPPEPPKPTHRFPWLWVILGAVVLLAAIGGVIWFLLKDVNVPDVVGKPQAEATQILKDAGFSAATTDKESSSPEGTVVTQSPEANKTAGRGSTINLEIATPVKSVVPAVLGSRIESARTAFQTAKIQLDFTQGSTCQSSPSGFLLSCVVVGVNPDVGSKVNVNALVLVRTELRQSVIIEPNPINLCMVQPQICAIKQ